MPTSLATLSDGAGRVILHANTSRTPPEVLPHWVRSVARRAGRAGFATSVVSLPARWARSSADIGAVHGIRSDYETHHVNRQRTRCDGCWVPPTRALRRPRLAALPRFANVGAGLHSWRSESAQATRAKARRSRKECRVAFRTTRGSARRGSRVRLAALSRYRFNDRGTSRRRPL